MVARQRMTDEILAKARPIKLLLTDCDGVLTDGGVYYSADGEELKRFSLRDGHGAARLRRLTDCDVGIITGENSLPLKRRAEKLGIAELHLGIRQKIEVLEAILAERDLRPEQVAYIGDDTNDIEVMNAVGLSASPSDGYIACRDAADYVCQARGGHGAFREFAELIISAQET